jgi:hypothetical protein
MVNPALNLIITIGLLVIVAVVGPRKKARELRAAGGIKVAKERSQ